MVLVEDFGKMKRNAILGWILVLALLMSLFCMPAMAEDAETGWWNILLLGSDSRDAEHYLRTDSIIILSVNREKGKAKMTSVMRDTWVEIPGQTEKAKINQACAIGGPELTIETVNQCFDMDIQHYVLVNMDDLVYFVDRVGGIDLNITRSELKWTNQYASNYLWDMQGVEPYEGETQLDDYGDVHMNGLLTMSYCRNRYSDNDYRRVMRQQKVLKTLAKKVQKLDTMEMLGLLNEALGRVETNLTLLDLMSLSDVGMTIKIDDIDQYRIPASGTYKAGMKDELWTIRPDFEENAKLLHEFIYGKYKK